MFLTVDGIDGAGKTTLASGLAAWIFENFALNVLLTKEPTNRSPWSKRLRAAALSVRLPREQELEFFHKDRLWHLKHVVAPAIRQHQVVICDRYVDSTLAYQAVDLMEADDLYSRMRSEIIIPDLTFILDCPVDVCFDRIATRNQPLTSFEKRETLERARVIFAARSGHHYRILDGSKSQGEVLRAAQAEVIRIVGAASAIQKRHSATKPVDPKSSSFSMIAAVA